MGVTKTLAELARFTGATLQGVNAEELIITGVGPLDQAGAGIISFLANKKYQPQLESTRAAAVVVPPGVETICPRLVSDNPYLDFVKIVDLFAPKIPAPAVGIHPMAFVHPEATLAAGVAVGPFCVINAGASIGAGSVLMAQVFVGENTRVGEQCCLYPNVVLREGLTIGNRVIIHPGAVIGSDGFGFAPDGMQYKKIPQIGTVVIEDDVEIGANTAIDRAALGETRIGCGSKLDNLIQIAHNVQVGENTVIAAQAGISGSTKIGKHVMVGGQVGTVGHIQIGDQAILGAQAGITRSVAGGEFVSGYPARPHKEAMKILGESGRLPELRKKVEVMEKRLKALEEK